MQRRPPHWPRQPRLQEAAPRLARPPRGRRGNRPSRGCHWPSASRSPGNRRARRRGGAGSWGGGAAAAGAGPGPRSLDSGGEMAAPVSTKAAWKLRECPPGPHPAAALAVVRASPLRAGGLGPSTGLAAR